MPKFNLSRWLFLEQVTNPTKDPGRFKAPEFFLVKTKGAVIVVDSKEYENAVQEKAENDWPRFLCGFAKMTEPDPVEDGQCFGSSFVSMMAANPKYPGAGYACISLLSKAFDVPLTGDRDNSTTDAAKNVWVRIEQSPDWERVPLDNFFGEYGTRDVSWISFVGNWPNRRMAKPKKTPMTKRKVDDCSLPGENINSVNSLLGSADGWFYIGSQFSPEPMELGGRSIFSKLFPGQEDKMASTFWGFAIQLFKSVYQK